MFSFLKSAPAQAQEQNSNNKLSLYKYLYERTPGNYEESLEKHKSKIGSSFGFRKNKILSNKDNFNKFFTHNIYKGNNGKSKLNKDSYEFLIDKYKILKNNLNNPNLILIRHLFKLYKIMYVIYNTHLYGNSVLINIDIMDTSGKFIKRVAYELTATDRTTIFYSIDKEIFRIKDYLNDPNKGESIPEDDESKTKLLNNFKGTVNTSTYGYYPSLKKIDEKTGKNTGMYIYLCNSIYKFESKFYLQINPFK